MKIEHSKKQLHRVNARKSKTPWAKYAKLIIAALIVILLLYIGLSPLRVSGSKKYLESGDNLLKERKFISAIVDYRKAEFLQNSENVEDRIGVARAGEKDLLKLEPFYKEVNDIDALNEIAIANGVPDNMSDGVKAAKSYIESNRPDLGILAATTVTEMDQSYQDAWTYLGLSNYYMLKDAEISSDAREFYKVKAREAWEKASSIDPTNENVQKYLDQLK